MTDSNVGPFLSRHFIWVNFVILLSSIMSIWFSSTFEDEAIFKAIFKEVGMAGLVAFVLNFSIEFVNRKKHEVFVEEIGNNLFKAVYGRNIDKNITTQLDKHVFFSDCIRRDYCVDIAFTKENNGQVVMSGCVTFEVENVTNHKKKIPVVKAVLDTMEEVNIELIQVGDSVIFRHGQEESELEDEPHAGEDERLSIKKVGDVMALTYSAELQPNQRIRVAQKYSKVVPDHYNETFSTTIPLDTFRLKVMDATGLNLKIMAVSVHPEDEKEIPTANPLHREWHINDVILPGQGIVLGWKHQTI